MGRNPCVCPSLIDMCWLWVADFWDDTGAMGHLTTRFTKHFSDWELGIVETFLSRLKGNLIRRDDNDKVVWKNDKKGSFSIKSFYEVLDVRRVIIVLKNIIWNLWVPSKVTFLHGNLIREEEC